MIGKTLLHWMLFSALTGRILIVKAQDGCPIGTRNCGDGICVNILSHCPNETCVSGLEKHCKEGCISVLAICSGCNDASEKSCSNGTCIPYSKICPGECADNKRLCPDGTCVLDFLNCPIICQVGMKKCRDDLCVLSSERCPCPRAEKKCGDDSCVSVFSNCPGECSVGGLTKMCRDKTCRRPSENCPGECSRDKKLCPDGTCVFHFQNCPCARNQKRCDDGTCVNDYAPCPCASYEIQCPDGRCVNSREECKFSSPKNYELWGLAAIPIILIIIVVIFCVRCCRKKPPRTRSETRLPLRSEQTPNIPFSGARMRPTTAGTNSTASHVTSAGQGPLIGGAPNVRNGQTGSPSLNQNSRRGTPTMQTVSFDNRRYNRVPAVDLPSHDPHAAELLVPPPSYDEVVTSASASSRFI